MPAKRLLMIAYHFPPLAGSSGVQRTLRFVQYLPRFGWEGLVLTAHPRAYVHTDDDLANEIPPGTVVRRAFALDTARHLALRGRYLDVLAQPDRWVSWKFAAIREGLRMIREYQPQAIWSTYPIATAHLIGAELARRSGLPWIADFRDPMAQDGYPANPTTWRAFKRIEEAAMGSASLCTFSAEGAARLYRERYPGASARTEVLENGYDEEAFAAAEADPQAGRPLNPGCLTLLHSGIVYPDERDPAALFEAFSRLQALPASAGHPLRIRFRAPVHEDLLRELATKFHLSHRIEVLPPLPYQEALAEMLRADGLLVLQAANCDEQIPAKVYEYFRAGKPIVALTSPYGDTARLLASRGVGTIAPLNDPARIADTLAAFVRDPGCGTPMSEGGIQPASRLERSRQLALLLDEIARRPALQQAQR